MTKRPPTRREQLLLGAFGLIFLLVTAFVVGSFYQRQKTELQLERLTLQKKVFFMEELLMEAELWNQRVEWLGEHQPPFPGEKSAESSIHATAEAAAHPELETWDVQFIQLAGIGEMIPAGVTFRMRGGMEDVMKWLHQLQSPERFYTVEKLSIQPDRDDVEKVICELQLVRWYAPPSASEESGAPLASTP